MFLIGLIVFLGSATGLLITILALMGVPNPSQSSGADTLASLFLGGVGVGALLMLIGALMWIAS